MAAAEQNSEFTTIKLKYSSLEQFAKAARTTFAKGRMTLKSKKDFNEGDRIVLAVSIPEQDEPVKIIAEVIQKADEAAQGQAGSYGVRWLNFTEKKLGKLLDGERVVGKAPPPKPPEKKPELQASQQKKAAPKPAPAPPPPPKPAAPPKPAPKPETKPAPKPVAKPAPPKPKPAPAPMEADEEYTISADGASPSFQDEPEVIVPPPKPEAKPKAPPKPAPKPKAKPAAKPAPPPAPKPAAEDNDENDLEFDRLLDEVEPAVKPTGSAPPAEEPMAFGADEPIEAGDDLEPIEDDGPTVSISPMEELEPLEPEPAELEPESAELEPEPIGERTAVADTSLDVQPEPPARAAPPEPPGRPLPPPPPSKQSDFMSVRGATEVETAHKRDGIDPLAPTEVLVREMDLSAIPQAGTEPEDIVDDASIPDDVLDDEIVEESSHSLPQAKPMAEEELAALGGFLSKLLRLMLQPEKLTSEESAGNIKTLFDEFKSVMSGRDEVGVYVRSAGTVQEFMLAGDVLEPVNLKMRMPSEKFSELSMRLVDFFKTRDLVGLQFRRYLTDESFKAFVLKMGDYEPVAETPEELASGLLQQGVFHATPVHASDRVLVGKNLDFRVDMTLTRLRGDVKRLQLLAEAIMEDPAALWTLRVEDALKAVPSGQMRAQVLYYADKVVDGQDLISEQDLLQEVVLATPVEMLSEAAEYLAGGYEQLFNKSEADKGNQELVAQLDRTRKVLRLVAGRLTVDFPDAASEIMGSLYKKGVFTLEELPSELREQIMLEQFIDFFLKDSDKRLADFAAIRTAKDYKNAAERYARMVGELVRKGEIEVAERIFKTLVTHVKTQDQNFPERQKIARQALSVLATPRSLKAMIASLGGAGKENREKIAPMIFAAGPGAAEALVNQLAVEEDRSLRRLICEILTRMGEKVGPLIEKKIRDPQSPWYLVRNLVMIMGDLKNPALKDDIEWLVSNEHPRVREEALVYAAKIMGAESEPILVRALADTSPDVRKKAARVVAKFPKPGDAALVAVVDMLEKMPPKYVTPEEEQAVDAGAELMARFGDRTLPDGRTAEDVLAGILESETGKGLLGRITGSKSTRTGRMKASLIESLGKVGTDKSQKLLAGFAKDKDKEVKTAAQVAMTSVSKK